jgi:Putative Ig domain
MALTLGGGGRAGISLGRRRRTISPTATGPVHVLTHRLDRSSTFSLVTGTNGNLQLTNGNTISTLTELGSGVSQIAVVREAIAAKRQAIEYEVVLTGDIALSALSLSSGSARLNMAVSLAIIGASTGTVLTAAGLPTGLTLDSAARTITGTPTQEGSFLFDLTETSPAGLKRTSAISLAISLSSVPVLSPAASWPGTPDHVTAPDESTTPSGTLVPDEQFTAVFSAIPGQWVHGQGVKITVVGLPPQPAATDAINYFKECAFFLEGSSALVTDWSVNDMPVTLWDGRVIPQGSIGFTVEIGAGVGAVKAGDAVLYAYVRAEHGLERRISIPLVINVDGSIDAVPLDFTGPLANAYRADLAAPWSGATGQYLCYFYSATSVFTRTVTLTQGATACTWSTGGNVTTANERAWLNRPKFFVDANLGSDSSVGNKPGSVAFQHINKALLRSISGVLIEPAAGIYVEDDIPGTSKLLARMAEIKPAPGTTADQVTITRSSRYANNTGRFVFKASQVHCFDLTMDLSKMTSIIASQTPNALAFTRSIIADPAGANGWKDVNGLDIGYNLTVGSGSQTDGANTLFPYSSTQKIYLSECKVVNYQAIGAALYRNVDLEYSADSFATGGGSNAVDTYRDVVVDGGKWTMERDFKQRNCADLQVEVASASYDAGADRTTIVLAGSPSIGGVSVTAGTPNTNVVNGDKRMQIVSGGLLGGDVAVYTANKDTFTIVVVGDVSGLQPGDLVRPYIIWHADMFQQQGKNAAADVGCRQLVLTRYFNKSPTAQLFLTAGQVNLSPTNVTCTTSGDGMDITFSASQTLMAGDFIRLTNGPQAGEARQIAADAVGTTARLIEPFSALQSSPRTCNRTKTMSNIAIYCSIFHKFENGNEIGQIADGRRAWTSAHNTFVSRQTNGLNTISMRNALPGAFSSRNHREMFNVYRYAVVSDSGTPLPTPADGLRFSRCQFGSGTDIGGDGAVGDPGIDANYRATSAITIGMRPLVPFDISGNRISAASPVGASVA